MAEAYQGLAVAFRYAQKPRMAMAYSRKAEEIARGIGAESLLANSLDNIGNCFYDILTEYEFPSKEIGIQDSALVCFNEAFEIMNRRNDVASLILNLGNMAGIYEAKKDYRYALKLMVSANEYAKINSAADDIGNTYSNIAAMYLQLQNFDSCGIYLDSARKYHAMHLDKRLLLSTYMLGAYLALDQGDYKTAYEQEVLRSALSDSLRNAKSKMKINYLELMMLTEDQRSELESKTASLQLTRLVVLASCICLVLLVIIGWQFFKSQRRRSMEKLTQQEQRATLQIMQSEQAERIRIARELHDGLGQPLSVAKMYLSHYNDADKPRELIDLAIQEVRGISHRLMPESLQLGLHAALESLALQVSEAGVLNCHYQGNIGDSIGQIPKETEVSLYRIAQEVINNSIKHAGAAHIQMVCTIDKEQLTLTIDDDGKGIDRQAVDNSKGIGWMNVYARAKGIDAVVDIHRRTKGTEVIVKLKLI